MRQEDDGFFTYHVEHVVPRQHGGSDASSNLALACYHCNRHKGPNLAALDPESGKLARLFDPRRDSWPIHFEVDGAAVLGRTAIGRATARLLKMNVIARLELRMALARTGSWP